MKRIYDLISRYFRECAAVLLFSVLLHVVYNFIYFPPENDQIKLLVIVLALLDLVALILVLRSLWRRKWRAAFVRRAQRIWGKASALVIRIFEKIFDKWGLGRSRQTVISGKTTVMFDNTETRGGKRRRKKARRWSKIEGNRERLGFLYDRMITKKIKSGMRVGRADTPSELKDRAENIPAESELFELYISSRYDERTPLDGDRLQKLKTRLEDRLDIK